MSQTTTEQNKAIALRFNQEGWGTQPNWEKVWDDIVSPEAIYHFNDEAEPIIGLAENKAFNAALFEGFPDISSTIKTVVASGDEVVYRTALRGTHRGNFLGISPTGKRVDVSDFTLLKVRDRKIVEWWYTCNLLKVMQQLGVV